MTRIMQKHKKYTKVSPEMAMIDMEEIYGTNVMSEGHIFQTGAAATIFIQDY